VFTGRKHLLVRTIGAESISRDDWTGASINAGPVHHHSA
jgi:hypothetical protein